MGQLRPSQPAVAPWRPGNNQSPPESGLLEESKYERTTESDGMDRAGHPGPDVRLRGRLRQGVKGAVMILLAALVTVLLFIYLLAALLRPEWF